MSRVLETVPECIAKTICLGKHVRDREKEMLPIGEINRPSVTLRRDMRKGPNDRTDGVENKKSYKYRSGVLYSIFSVEPFPSSSSCA
jgi:hypothetical protein